MKRRIWPSSPRRCGRNAGKRPSMSVTNSGRLAAALAISRTLLVCFWNAFGNSTLTDITLSCPRSGQAELLVKGGMFFDKVLEIGKARADGLALIVSSLQHIG